LNERGEPVVEGCARGGETRSRARGKSREMRAQQHVTKKESDGGKTIAFKGVKKNGREACAISGGALVWHNGDLSLGRARLRR